MPVGGGPPPTHGANIPPQGATVQPQQTGGNTPTQSNNANQAGGKSWSSVTMGGNKKAGKDAFTFIYCIMLVTLPQ